MRMTVPFLEAAHGGHDQSGIGGRLLEVGRAPGTQRLRDCLALSSGASRQPEQRQHAVAMMGKVGVQPDPAALAIRPAGVKAGDLVPDFRGAAVKPEIAAAFERRFTHVDADLLGRSAAQGADLNRGQRSGGHADLGRGADRKR